MQRYIAGDPGVVCLRFAHMLRRRMPGTRLRPNCVVGIVRKTGLSRIMQP